MAWAFQSSNSKASLKILLAGFQTAVEDKAQYSDLIKPRTFFFHLPSRKPSWRPNNWTSNVIMPSWSLWSFCFLTKSYLRNSPRKIWLLQCSSTIAESFFPLSLALYRLINRDICVLLVKLFWDWGQISDYPDPDVLLDETLTTFFHQ